MAYLDPHIGSWTEKEARHLLRRATYGPSQAMVETAVADGLATTLNSLFTLNPLPDPPVKYVPDGTGRGELNDPGAIQGATWVNAAPMPNSPDPMLNNRIIMARRRSLWAWMFLTMYSSGTSIQEKLTLFWHNHFVVGGETNPTRAYVYQLLLRTHALGNFKQLTKDITIDPSMLIYLSGTENSNQAPNENYSRELLELFTVGKGPLVAPGDYTNYTEDDVEEMAKALTGWRALGLRTGNGLEGQFFSNRHTSGNKQLSHRFNNAVIANNNAEEYKDLIDVIFQQDECSRFIMRKLYRWFVHSEIDADIEMNVIEPLATNIRANNYDIVPALRILLASEHFFGTTACMIKSPIDLIMSTARGLDVMPNTSDVEEEYDFGLALYALAGDLEQRIFDHPDVAGWKAWYQEPVFDRSWINNVLLPRRNQFCEGIVKGGTVTINGVNYNLDPWVPVLAITASVPNASDPNVLVETLANRFFAYPIATNQKDTLKEFLTAGLPDFEWTVEYNDFLQNPNDVNLRLAVENKLRNMIGTMVQMSEFQLM